MNLTAYANQSKNHVFETEWAHQNMMIQVDKKVRVSYKGTFYEIDKDGNSLQE